MDRTSLTLLVVAVAAALGLYMALAAPTPANEPLAAPPPAGAPAEPATPAAPVAAEAETRRPTQATPEDPALPSPAAAIRTDEVMLPVRAGPLEELKHAFETEPRASAARELELRVEAELTKPDIPAGMYRSVLCRSTVCRIQMRWRPERLNAYNVALVRMLHIFGMGVGTDPGPPDKDGEVDIDVYMKRVAVPAASQPG
jgi:hypothetical protein